MDDKINEGDRMTLFMETEAWKVIKNKFDLAYNQLNSLDGVSTIKEIEGKKWARKVLSDFIGYLEGTVDEVKWLKHNKEIKKTTLKYRE